MFRFIFRFLALTGFLVIAGVIGGIWLISSHEEPEPQRIVLSINLSDALAEAAGGGLEDTLDRRVTLTDILDALERAETDPKVKGLVARFDGDSWGQAKAHELRDAIRRFRASGRFAIAHADAFGEGQPAALAYSVAAAFDEVWMQPMGMVSLNWPGLSVPFAKRALEWLGVEAQVEKREAYKTFADTFTETGLTREHAEMLNDIATRWGAEVVEAIAKGRNMPADKVRALMDAAPIIDQRAVDDGLIDRLAFRDEAVEEAKRRAGPDAETVTALDYLDWAGPPHDHGVAVAMIHAVGEVARGEADDADIGGLDASATRLSRAFTEAIDDDAVKAIILRIDSPGGSATASETIRHAVLEAKKAGKPVIATMGDVAASGGYWIAMDADKIIAAPGTLTGSIGVVTGKFALKGAFAKLGVDWDGVRAGPGADFWSPLTPLDQAGAAKLSALTDQVYDAFLRRVAAARHMPIDKVRAAAGGRVWTGAAALDKGLVDAVGGRREALVWTRRLLNLDPSAPIELRPYPEPGDTLDQILALLRHDGGVSAKARSLIRASQAINGVHALLSHLGLYQLESSTDMAVSARAAPMAR